MKKGLRGEIEYTVYDYSLNKTVVKGVIEVLDTIAPEIKVNINHEGFYKKLDKIEVEVTDNFDDNVTINVYLDKNRLDKVFSSKYHLSEKRQYSELKKLYEPFGIKPMYKNKEFFDNIFP